MKIKKFDFSGYATKAGLVCTDGRTIMHDAFKHQDGAKVPLVWQHMHSTPDNILGSAYLEHRDDGTYCYGVFNDSESGKKAKLLVEHGDVTSLSIYANQLQEQGKKVLHGAIREVSLVLAGANPGAFIDNISFAHGDGTYTEDDTEAIISMNLELAHSEEEAPVKDESKKEEAPNDPLAGFTDEQKALVHSLMKANKMPDEKAPTNDLTHAAKTEDTRTVQDIFNTFTDEQKNVAYFLIGNAIAHAEEEKKEVKQSDVEGDSVMKNNVFDQSTQTANSKVLSHSQLKEIMADAKKMGSLKDSYLAHVATYGFDDATILFPDAKDVNGGEPTLIQRDTTWVDDVLANTNHTPFSRIRTRFADVTADEARAKGYVTGNLKKEEVIALSKRVTTPTTIYKKQKLERDDVIDITDFDVVVWLKKEMRMMLNEEIARAVLIGDGRSIAAEDKINETNVRPIALDDGNVFVHRVSLEKADTTTKIIDEIIRARKSYKGSGNPAFYAGTDLLTDMLLLKDGFDHYLYKNTTELASVLRVSKIIEVEPMNTAVRVVGEESRPILGVIVNLKDYTIGADKGGQVAMFDDFDIDYNQMKYLMETRISGALTLPKSAIVLERKAV